MMREQEVKRAFRTAYDVLSKCGKPENDSEYMLGVIRQFEEAWRADMENELLRYLSVGICAWIGDLAMKEKK